MLDLAGPVGWLKKNCRDPTNLDLTNYIFIECHRTIFFLKWYRLTNCFFLNLTPVLEWLNQSDLDNLHQIKIVKHWIVGILHYILQILTHYSVSYLTTLSILYTQVGQNYRKNHNITCSNDVSIHRTLTILLIQIVKLIHRALWSIHLSFIQIDVPCQVILLGLSVRTVGLRLYELTDSLLKKNILFLFLPWTINDIHSTNLN